MARTSRQKYRNWKQKFKSEGNIITLMMMGRLRLWLPFLPPLLPWKNSSLELRRHSEEKMKIPFGYEIAISSRNIRKVWKKLEVRFMKQRERSIMFLSRKQQANRAIILSSISTPWHQINVHLFCIDFSFHFYRIMLLFDMKKRSFCASESYYWIHEAYYAYRCISSKEKK